VKRRYPERNFLDGRGLGVCWGDTTWSWNTPRSRLRFMFFWVGVLMIGFPSAFCWGPCDETDPKGIRTSGRNKVEKILSVLAALVLYAYAFTFLGFILCTVPCSSFSLKAVEPQKWTWASGSGPDTLTAYGVFQLCWGVASQGLLG